MVIAYIQYDEPTFFVDNYRVAENKVNMFSIRLFSWGRRNVLNEYVNEYIM